MDNKREYAIGEDLSRMVLKHMEDLVYCCDLQGIGVYCSPSLEKKLGYAPEEIIGVPFSQWGLLEETHSWQDIVRNGRGELQVTLKRKNGAYLPYDFHFSIAEEADNGPLFIAVGREVSLSGSEIDILKETMGMARIGSWEWSLPDDRVIWLGDVFRMLRFDQANNTVTSKEVLSKFSPRERERFLQSLGEALESGVFDFEFRHTIPETETEYLHLRGTVSYDNSGTPVRMSGTVQDITDRKRVERKLQETVERYNSLKKYNHDAVFSLDLRGHVINANAMAEKLTGYEISKMTGQRFSMFIGESKLRDILSAAKSNFSTPAIDKSINSIRQKDGQEAEVLATVAPIIIGGENVGFYIIAKDIREQKQLLIAKEAAERTNRAKSEFLAMMSHEIRTPMNGIIGMTDLMIEMNELSETQKEYLEIIRKSGDTLLAIINDILDFAKIEAGKSELHESTFDLRLAVSETLDILKVRANEKGLALSFNADPAIPGLVIGDPDRLKQILMNLIGNALKFTYSGGITVEVSCLSQAVQQLRLCFAVKDTGIGIPEEKVALLFKPFSQLDQFMTRRFEGTGLGLAITKKLVEMMEGKIWVEQHQGPGVTFKFEVTLGAVYPQEDEDPGMEQHQGARKLHILIAEDNEVNQIVLQKMLEQQGHTTKTVANGYEVIQAVAYEAFDIIFMDVHMPEMNGLDAAKVLKETLAPGACPVIIAVTANALNEDRNLCLQAGMDDYICKPLKSTIISETLQKYI